MDIETIKRNIEVLGVPVVNVKLLDGEACIYESDRDSDIYTDGWITPSSKGLKIYNHNIIIAIDRDSNGIAVIVLVILKNLDDAVDKLFEVINMDTAKYIFN